MEFVVRTVSIGQPALPHNLLLFPPWHLHYLDLPCPCHLFSAFLAQLERKPGRLSGSFTPDSQALRSEPEASKYSTNLVFEWRTLLFLSRRLKNTRFQVLWATPAAQRWPHAPDTGRGVGAHPHGRKPAWAKALVAQRKGETASPRPSVFFPPGAPPHGQSLRTSPSRRTAASREGAAAGGTVRPPRAARTVGPSSRRKALWEQPTAFLASALGSRGAARRLPEWRGLRRARLLGLWRARAPDRGARPPWGWWDAFRSRAGPEDPVPWVRGGRTAAAWPRPRCQWTAGGSEAAPRLRTHARKWEMDGFECIWFYWSSTACQGDTHVSRGFFRVKEKGLTIGRHVCLRHHSWDQVNVGVKCHLRFRSW